MRKNLILAFHICILAVSPVIPFVDCGAQEVAAVKADNVSDAQDIREMASSRIAENYSRFNSIRARFAWVQTTANKPEQRFRWYFVSRGTDYKCEWHSLQDNGWKCSQAFALSGNDFAEWYPGRGVITRKLSDAPGFSTLDPREWGGGTQKTNFIDVLNRGSLVEVIQEKGEIELETQKNGWTHRYTLDVERNYLPVRVVSYRPDGLVNSELTLVYDQLLPDAWFVSKVQLNFAHPHKITQIDDETNWGQTILCYSVGQPEIDSDIADDDLAIRAQPE